MPVRFGYDESLPDNWTNTGDTYNGPGIASNMQSYGMNGSPYSALVPQGQANPFAGTLAMNPGATDTNNFSAWEAQFQNPMGSSPSIIGSPGSLYGSGRPDTNANTIVPGSVNTAPRGRPLGPGEGGNSGNAGGVTGGYDPNWQPLLTPYNTSNPGAAGDPDAWVRNLDQETYYKYILPYQQRGGNIRDISAMQKVIQDGMSANGGGQWANGSQVNNVAGQRNNYINDPNAYGNQNRGGVAAQPQPTQNGSVSNTPQFNWQGLPSVDPATNMGGGVLDQMFRANQARNNQPSAGGGDARQQMIADFYRTNGVAQPGNNPSGRADYVQHIDGSWGPANNGYDQRIMSGRQQYAPGSMEERYAAMYGGGGSINHMAYPTGGMDQPWNQGGPYGTAYAGSGNTPTGAYREGPRSNWNGGPEGPVTQMPSGMGQQATMQDLQNFYNSGGQNPNFDLASLFQQYMGGNGGQVSGYGGGAQGAPPGSIQQRSNALFYQNPNAVFGSPAAGGGTSNSSGSGGGSSATPVMASPSFGFGSATGRRTGYGNQNSYYGGSSNPNSFGGSNFGNFSTASGGGNSATNRPYIYPNSSQSSNSTGGFAAGRTGRPSGFTF